MNKLQYEYPAFDIRRQFGYGYLREIRPYGRLFYNFAPFALNDPRLVKMSVFEGWVFRNVINITVNRNFRKCGT